MKQLLRFTIICLYIVLTSTWLIAQSADTIPGAVKAFYGLPIKPNPKAPSETAQFGRLEGIWHCKGFEPDGNGGLKPSGSAYWAWKYILDGYGVQDFWYQGENESQYWSYFKRELMLTQLRIYDVNEKIWKIAFINNNAGEVPGRMFGLFTAQANGDDMVMQFEPQEPELLKRIVFYDIDQESFKWKVEVSQDKGETWKRTSYISATRIK